MNNLFRVWRTVRHLKLVQIINRIYRRFVVPKGDNSPAPHLRANIIISAKFISRPQSILGNNQFNFLNKKETLPPPLDWNDGSLPKLWLYNLHYFEGLMNRETSSRLKGDFIQKWIEDNPAGQGNGWEPYPNSLRICNWIKWALSGNELSRNAINSLAVQTRYLMKTLEFHLLGNHLFANAKALIFAGRFFEGDEADKWLKKGLAILKKQIPEQFNTGIHFELSPTYHTLLLEDLLDLHNLLQVTPYNISTLGPPLEYILEITQNITRPDGLMPLFNDAAYGVTPITSEILEYAARLKILPYCSPSLGMQDFTNSGYFKYDTESYNYIGDAGAIGPDYLPGHAHCDMMNFELFAKGSPVIVDTGTSTYEIGERRQYERSTSAHNTVQVGSHEQSELWGGFRFGRRAEILERIIGPDFAKTFMKSHKYKHRRDIQFSENVILIKDTVDQGSNNEICTARYHFHPDIEVIIEGGTVTAGPIKLLFSDEMPLNIEEYSYAPEFNKLQIATCLEIYFKDCCSVEISIN